MRISPQPRKWRVEWRSFIISVAVALILVSHAVDAAASNSSSVVSSSSTCAIHRQLLSGPSSCSAAACGDLNANAACIAFSKGINSCAVSLNTSHYIDASDSFTFFVTPTTAPAAIQMTILPAIMRQNEWFIDSVGSLDMPDRVKYVSIIGGFSLDDLNSSAVSVGTRVALQLSGKAVTNLTLANLNMTTSSALPATSLEIHPSLTGLQSLRIVNCQLTTLPIKNNTALASLTTLDLSRNRMVAFPQERSLESLLHLNLRNNNLMSLDATFPALQSLDLSGNLFTSIPSNIILFTQLKSLDLSRNPLENALLTPAQFNFLKNISSLTMDNLPPTDCTEANKRLLKTSVVCVVESSEVVVLRKSSLAWYVVVPVLVTATVTLAGFSLWYYRRKKHNAKLLAASNNTGSKTLGSDQDQQATEDHHSADAGYLQLRNHHSSGDGALVHRQHKRLSSAPSSHSLWTDEELLACQLRYDDIEDIKQIGSGAFAIVWLVNYRQTTLLASKRLVKDQQLTRQKTQAFVSEIKLNLQLDHPSIVRFVGVAWTVETDLQALFEYMSHGDLRSFLETTSVGDQDTCWTSEKLQIAIDIVEALVYVHSFSPPLVHRDLKSRNVLLAEDMKAKLSDFGVSRFQSQTDTMTAGVGTGKWLAPEVLSGESDYDHSCDIYSFGVLLSELDTHELPYEELRMAEVAILQMVVAGSVRPRFRDDCPAVVRELATKCLAPDRRQRPSAMEIAFVLRTLAKTTLESNRT